MKLQSLINDALVAAKLLLVLSKSPLLKYSKAGKKSIDRLRGYIDLCVVSAVAAREGDSRIDMAVVSACLESADKHIRSIICKLHPNLLVLGATKSSELYRAGCSNTSSLHVAVRNVERELPFSPLEQASLKLMAGIAGVPEVRRGAIAKLFGHVVRNGEWLSVLLALGVELTSEDLPKYLKALEASIGSRQGRAQAADKLAELTGVPVAQIAAKRTRRGVAAAADIAEAAVAAVITVSLEPAILSSLPRVRELSMSHHDLTPRITDILQAAALPVRVDAIDKVQPAIDAKLKAFAEGLDKRAKLIADARAKSEKDALEAQRARALEALKGLGPLAQVLKDNPDLLKQV